MTDKTVHIFCSYSHKDEEALEDLKAHLAEVRRQGLIDDWHDRRIKPGEDWAQAIDDALEKADIVLLLISPGFMKSEYCNGVELKQALKQVRAGRTRVIPIYIEHAYWEGAPFARFQGLPDDALPVYDKDVDPNKAWVGVVEGIVRAVRELRGDTTPRRGFRIWSPGLERSRFGPRLVAAGLLVLLLAGFAVWWLTRSMDPALSARLSEGRIFLNTGRYEKALEKFDAALALAPDHPEAILGREKASVLAGIGPDFNAEVAAARLRVLDQEHPNDAHVQMMQARLAAAGGDGERAWRLFQRAAELDPDVAQAWFALGVLSHKEGRLEEARKLYAKALALAPEHRQYCTNMAALHLELGEFEEARKKYEKLLEVSPNVLLARLDAGAAARLAGNLEIAAWHHQRLLKHLSQPVILESGDNAAQWVFDTSLGPVTMDAPDAKRSYALLNAALTLHLTGDDAGAAAARESALDLPESARAAAVLHHDMERLLQARPEWGKKIHVFGKGLGRGDGNKPVNR